jgi:hypothetical protein
MAVYSTDYYNFFSFLLHRKEFNYKKELFYPLKENFILIQKLSRKKLKKELFFNLKNSDEEIVRLCKFKLGLGLDKPKVELRNYNTISYFYYDKSILIVDKI